jgi:hypothetical protein
VIVVEGRREMEMRYSRERKEAILKKLPPPMSRSMNELAATKGISAVTLYEPIHAEDSVVNS